MATKNWFQTANTAAIPTIFAGPQTDPVVTREIPIKAETGDLVRGQVLGLVYKEPDTPGEDPGDPVVPGGLLPYAQHHCVPVDKDATDGSADVYCILAEDVANDETNAQKGIGYFSGGFNREALTFKAGNTWQDHDLSARKVFIHFRSVVGRVEV